MNDPTEKNQIRELNRIQRRVLGTLIEKGLTTPDQYPLTLKSTTSGCNQKSNRAPVSSYSEDEILDALEELRELGLVAEVYTDGGRAARYKHYTRVKFDFSETQLAIITELWLRGRQQLGELRSRASRMARIENQEALKSDLKGLQKMGFVQANGPLDRRGIEVDHAFYLAGEKMRMSVERVDDSPGDSPVTPSVDTATERGGSASPGSDAVSELTEQLNELKSAVESLNDRLSRLESELGG